MFAKRVAIDGSLYLYQLTYSDIKSVEDIPDLNEILNFINSLELLNQGERELLKRCIISIFNLTEEIVASSEYIKIFNSLRLGIKGHTLQIQASTQNKDRIIKHLNTLALRIYEENNISHYPGIPHPNAIVRLALMNLIKEKGELVES